MKQRGLWETVQAHAGEASVAARLPKQAVGEGAQATGVAIPMSWAVAQGKIDGELARVMTLKEAVFVMMAKRLGMLE
jgi:hypothetical protein